MKIEERPFINRRVEMTSFRQRGEAIAQGRGEDLFLIAPWGSGKTTLLKELKDALFWDQKDLIPIYFSFSRDYIDLFDFIEDYLVIGVSQILLFDQKERIGSPASERSLFTDLQREAERQEKDIIGEIILHHQKAEKNKDVRKGLLNALTAPKRIAHSLNRPVWVMVDHIQKIESLRLSGKNIAGLWTEGLNTPWAAHLFAGEPSAYILKYILPAFGPQPISALELSALPAEAGEGLIPVLEKTFRVKLAADLSKNWFDYLEHNPGIFTAFVKEARKQNSAVESHQRFVEIYLKALWQGEIGLPLETRLFHFWKESPLQGALLLRILSQLSKSDNNRLSCEALQHTLSLSPEEIYPLIRILEQAGLGREQFGILGLEKDRVLLDWVKVLIRKYLLQEDLEQVFQGLGREIEKQLSEKAERHDFPPSSPGQGLQFSMVLPVNGESELVAVRALEQIATYTDLEPAGIEKAKLALIEACINASEHSQNFEKKIRLYFEARPEVLKILVEDRGKAFDPVEVQARMIRKDDPLSQRRGLGLSLIREMMDEVRFEKAEVGTRLYMVKKKHATRERVRDNEEF